MHKNTAILMRDGKPYSDTRITQFFGNGVQKSCAKCGEHKSVVAGEFKNFKAWGLCCRACRGAD